MASESAAAQSVVLLLFLLCALLWGTAHALPIGVALARVRRPRAQSSADTAANRAVWVGLQEGLLELSPCGQHCACDQQATYADCSHKDLTDVPSDIPVTVQHLNLRNNYIHVLQGEPFNKLTELKSIDLSSNKLQKISPTAFQHNVHLAEVNLAHNDLSVSQLSFLQTLTSSVKTLSLRGNNLDQDSLEVLANISLDSLERLDLSECDLNSFSLPLLESLPRLQELLLNSNNISSFDIDVNTTLYTPELISLSLSNNSFQSVDCHLFHSIATNLQKLDLSHNNISSLDENCFVDLINLSTLSLSGTHLTMLPTVLLANLTQIVELHLNNMSALSFLQPGAFDSQINMERLDLSYCPKLNYVHAAVFSLLHSLRSLNLNHTGLTSLHRNTFQHLESLQELWLGGVQWHCDCDLLGFQLWLSTTHVKVEPPTPVCTNPSELAGRLLLSLPPLNFSCAEAQILNHTQTTYFKIGESVVMDCVVDGDPRPNITWITNKQEVLTHMPAFLDYSLLDPMDVVFHDGHPWHNGDKYSRHGRYQDNRISVLRNGSLYIDFVTRGDGGHYTCIASNPFGNDSVIITLRLNYDIIQETTVISIILGFVSAFGFFLIAVLIAVIRYVAFFCSSAERKKRKGIRDILGQIQEYKCTRFDRLRDYKTAKVETFSSYKREKMDKLVAFKTAKIDKLRTYKQATVTNMIHHLETMQAHYQGQMTKVKENCMQQVEKLRENYAGQMGRLKDYKSTHVEKVRDNYNNQLLKIREYSSNQMIKLRDQYKLQQQHAIKLLELLDVGNCLTVIEAECMRTESMLFDPNISFDLEAQPVHFASIREADGADIDYTLPDMVLLTEENAIGNEADNDTGQTAHQSTTGNMESATDPTSPTHAGDSPQKQHGKHRRRRKHRHTARTGESANAADEDEENQASSRNQTPRHHKPSKHRSKEHRARQALELPLLTAAAAALTIPMGESEEHADVHTRHCRPPQELSTVSTLVCDGDNQSIVVEAEIPCISSGMPTGGDITPQFESAVQSRKGSPIPANSPSVLSSPQSFLDSPSQSLLESPSQSPVESPSQSPLESPSQSMESTLQSMDITSEDNISVVTVDPALYGSLAHSNANESIV